MIHWTSRVASLKIFNLSQRRTVAWLRKTYWPSSLKPTYHLGYRIDSAFNTKWKFGARFAMTTSAKQSSSDTPKGECSFEEKSEEVYQIEKCFISPLAYKPLPTYRVMDANGNVVNPAEDPQLPKEEILRLYEGMVTLNIMDQILYEVQRHGRISFYMTSFGEEATHFGSAAALDPNDVIFGQYREAGVLMYRGFTLEQFANQCTSNMYDLGKGRQMPVHYGSRALNFQTISSPLATQIPQASGSAYAQKLMGSKNITIVYFGEGAASEGDFHAALNFAATLECPTLFFCRNNKWAISTPAREQYRGDGIAIRGIAYGMHTIRVDGNDIWAVYNATKKSREFCSTQGKPVLIEAMTYRVGHHSTSDDYTKYRSQEEVDQWKNTNNPITRLRLYMQHKGLWNDAKDKELQTRARQNVLDALKKAEAQPKPPIEELFTDVYDELTPQLREQQQELFEHLKKYPDDYPIAMHAKRSQ